MARRGDNIRKRKDGRWEARYPKTDTVTGQVKYCSVYGRTYREAKEKRIRLAEQQNDVHPKSRDWKFKEVLASWQESNCVRLKESSVSRYQNLIDTHILPSLGDLHMSQLNAAAVNGFLVQKLKTGRINGDGGLSASYVRSIMQVINSAIRFGVAENLCSPLNQSIAKPTLSRRELKILSKKEQRTLEKTLLSNMNEVKLMVYITLYTGIRIGEACALRWEDIDLKSRVIQVRRTVSRVWFHDDDRKYSKLTIAPPKTTSSHRFIPICSKLGQVLSGFPFRKATGYILTCNGEFASPRSFEYQYKKVLQEASVQCVNYHALRHTFATRCVESGVDVKSLSEMLGHANVSITLNTYVHSSIELKRIQLEKLVHFEGNYGQI